MSRITAAIAPQGFELIRNRIGEIIADELSNQAALLGDEKLDATVFVERTSPIDKTELPVINVSLSNGKYENKHQGSVDGTYAFNVDVFTKSKSTDNADGDVESAFILQRIIGICRSILENPIYNTLGFATPFIGRTYCSEINIAAPGKDDSINTMMGRLTFNVMCNEPNVLISPALIAEYNTQVKLELTDKGFYYQKEV